MKKMKYKFLVGNEWRKSGKTVEVRDPYDDSVVGEVYLANHEDLQDALEATESAFEVTKKQTSEDKVKILEKIVDALKCRSEELAKTITREAGKPITLARVEVSRAIDTFSDAIRVAKEFDNPVEVLELGKGDEKRTGMTRRFPIGPVLGITPFNFPLYLVAHKIAPAIVAGNPIIIKPALKTPITALKLAEIIKCAGVILGQVSVVPTFDYVCEHILIPDPRIKVLSFTGSAKAGWYLKTRVDPKTRVTLELGGNAALVIDKGVDIKPIMERSVFGAFAFAGQSCIHTQRIYVHSSMWKRFLKLFIDEMRKLKVGNPLDPEVVIGPMISRKEQERVWHWMAETADTKAHLEWTASRHGPLIWPMVLSGTDNSMKIHREENFGPAVCINRFKDFEEVIREVNDSRYGLQVGVHTKSIEHQFYAWEHLEVGGVIINDIPGFRSDEMPYGGCKDSGQGKEGVKYAVQEMTDLRLVVFDN